MLSAYNLFSALNIVSLTCYSAITWLHKDSIEALIKTGVFGNQSLFAILLAAQILFIFPAVLHRYKNRKLFRCLIVLIAAASFGLLLIIQGRAAWMGFAGGGLFIFYHYLPVHKKWEKLYWPAVLVSGIALSSLFWFKPDSSNGRLFIYKIAATIYKDHWLWGIGAAQYKVQHNLYQAAYFKKHDINSKEAVLADNTFYAFNDAAQFIIENGVAGIIIICMAGCYLIKRVKQLKKNSSDEYIYLSAGASLICIITASLFSYPFHIPATTVFALLCLLFLFNIPITTKKNQELKWIPAKEHLVWITCLLTVSYYAYSYFYRSKANEAWQLSRSGFKKESLALYKSLHQSYKKDGPTLFQYAKELYAVNQLVEAQRLIEETKEYYTENEVYKLSADIAYELGDYNKAEKDYKTAVYMVPNRMRSRAALFQFYVNTKDTANAVLWGGSILKMPVKVHSATTDRIQEQTQASLNKLNGK